MNNGINADRCTVVIMAPDLANRGMYIFPRSTTVSNIGNHWRTQNQMQGAFRFKLEGGNDETLDGDRTISSIVGNDNNYIILVPEPILQLRLKFGNEETDIRGLLSQTTAELLEKVVEIFPSLNSQLFCLATENGVLVDELSLLEQGVDAEKVLRVETCFDIELVNQWCESERLSIIAFPSESLSAVLDNDWLKDHRFIFQDCYVNQHDRFRDFIQDPFDAPVTIKYAHSHRITLFINGEFHERVVWPDTQVKEMSSVTRLAFSDRILDTDSSMVELSIPHQALLHDVVEVDLIGHLKTYHVSVPRMGCLLDVATAIPLGKCLQSPETIRTDCIVRLPPKENLTVELDDVDVNWVVENGPFSFTQFVEELAKESGRDHCSFRKNVFQCCGCGRRIKAEEEEFQLIPAACCSVRSLRLSVIPTIKKTTIGVTASAVLVDDLDEPPVTCDVATSTSETTASFLPADTVVNDSDEDPQRISDAACSPLDEYQSVEGDEDESSRSQDIEEKLPPSLEEGDITFDVVLRKDGNGFGLKLFIEKDDKDELKQLYKITVNPGSPAEKGGIRSGDYLKEVHCDVTKMQKDATGDLIRNVGNTLHITILRKKDSENFKKTQTESSFFHSSSTPSDKRATKKKTDFSSWFIK